MSQKLMFLGTSQVQFDQSDLHSAIAQGYTVVVISTRCRSSIHKGDDAWMSLVPADQIYFVEYRLGWGCEDPQYAVPWRKVFARYNLLPPIDQSSWLYWRNAAKEQGVALKLPKG